MNMTEQVTKAATEAGLFNNDIRKGFTNDYLKALERMVELLQQGEAVAYLHELIIEGQPMQSLSFSNKHNFGVRGEDFDPNAIVKLTHLFTPQPDTQQKLDKAREALQYIETQTTEGWLLNVVQQALKDTE